MNISSFVILLASVAVSLPTSYSFVTIALNDINQLKTLLNASPNDSDFNMNRRTVMTTAVITLSTIIHNPLISNSFDAPPSELVKSIENANYVGNVGRPIYTPNINGESKEHLPQVKIDSNQNIEVSVKHKSSVENGYIKFIWLKDVKTNEVVLVRGFTPTDPDPPILKARVPKGVELRAYSFCNVHGLWKGDPFIVP